MKYKIIPEPPSTPTHPTPFLTTPALPREELLRRRHITENDLREVTFDDGLYRIVRYSGSQIRVYYKGKEWKSCRSNKIMLRLFLAYLAAQESLGTPAPFTTFMEADHDK